MANSNYGRLLRIMVIGNYGVVIIVMANLWLSFFFLIMVMGNFTIIITINSPVCYLLKQRSTFQRKCNPINKLKHAYA